MSKYATLEALRAMVAKMKELYQPKGDYSPSSEVDAVATSLQNQLDTLSRRNQLDELFVDYLSAETLSAERLYGTLEWSNVSGRPTTLSGYGITDAVTSTTFNSHVANYNALSERLTSTATDLQEKITALENKTDFGNINVESISIGGILLHYDADTNSLIVEKADGSEVNLVSKGNVACLI